jgi:hypothetical protein
MICKRNVYQPVLPEPVGSGKIAAVVRSASTSGAPDAEAQIEEFFAGYDSSNKGGWLTHFGV